MEEFSAAGAWALKREVKPCEGCGGSGVSTGDEAGCWGAVGGLGFRRASSSSPQCSLQCCLPSRSPAPIP